MRIRYIRIRRILPIFILIAVLAAFLYPVATVARDTDVRPSGSIEEVDGITVVRLSGTPRELGYQHGKLLGDRLPETEAAFKKIMPPIPGGAVGRWLVRQFVMLQVKRIEGYLDESELEELKGIADADTEHKGTYRDILYYHVLQDIGQNYACTGAVAAGRRSRFSGPVAGRNFDLSMRGLLDPLKTVFYSQPEKGYPFVSVAWPGMVGAVSGMNDRGLCVMVFSAKSEHTRLSGVPVAFIAKRLLKEASTVSQAVDIIKKTTRMGPNIFLVADREKAAAIEFDSEKVGVIEVNDGILPLSNHFYTKELSGDKKNIRQARYSDSRQRYDRIKSLIEDAGHVGVREMLSVLRDHSGRDGKVMAWGDYSAVNNIKDAHSVIFDTVGLRFWVSTPPSAYGKFVGFKLTRQGPVRIEDLPADRYPDSEEGRRAALSDTLMQKVYEADENGLHLDARLFAEKALATDPENYIAAIRVGEAYVSEYHYDKALKAFEQAVQCAPEGSAARARALVGRGESLMHAGKNNEAKADFDEVIKMDCCTEANEAALKGLSRI